MPRFFSRITRTAQFVSVFFAVTFPGLAQAQNPLQSEPLKAAPANKKTMPGFTRLHKAETGIDFKNLLKKEHIKKYLYTGAGGCVGDYDGDGLPDLYLVSQDDKNRLFRQTAPWKFKEVTDHAGVDGGEPWSTGSSFVDIDNDGDLDLYVCKLGNPNLLYINQGDGTFTEEAADWGLNHNGASIMASFADYDRDGLMDCYLLTYRVFELAEEHPQLKIRYDTENKKHLVHPDFIDDYHFIEGHMAELGRQDRLLRNEGDGTFRDVTGSAGLSKVLNLGLSATWWDYNNDGWPDLYVANDFYDPDKLWRNNGDGTFTDVLPAMAPSTAWFAMGSDFGDINRDGWLDYFVSDMSAPDHYGQKMRMGEMGASRWFLEWAEPRQFMRNPVFLNSRGERFREIGYLSGLESTGWSWAARFADLDCDGWEDAFFTNGMARDVNNSDHLVTLKTLKNANKLEERLAIQRNYDLSGAEHSKVFRNRGDLTFEDVSEKWNYHDKTASFGLICADLDRDGDLDLVVNNMNQPVGIYRNDTSSGHRLLIALRGQQSNHFGVGARLRLKSASGWQTRLLSLARGYMSADEPIIHFGLGKDELVEQLKIDWPSGAKQVLKDLKVDRLHTITEPEGKHQPGPALRQPEPRHTLFSMDAVPGLEFTHQENEFDDYKDNPLLPWRLSRFGPGIAFGDADNDGDDDLIVGGAANQEAMLFLRSEDGRWISAPWGPWIKDNQSEDMGMLWFDPDKDGDLDLYVTSGGATFASNSPELEDRLYLNQGKDGFNKAKPDPKERTLVSGSVIAAADMDRDGDIDLFSGGRMALDNYPNPARQRLLVNVGDKITDKAKDLAPDLNKAGMVTSALWSDIDNDGALDLLVTTAWGPVRVYRNQDGKLVETTDAAGLSKAHGWWQGIAGGDIDGDGDIDYVATNLGRNTKYHASPEHPVELYTADFDGDGKVELVEAEYENGTLFPVRGRSCSSEAMPFIKEKFKTFDAFAKADLAQIYTKPKLESALHLQFTHLDSSVLVNDGEGHFTIRSLPIPAQIAPGFGVVLEDFDGDGNLDIAMAQNFYSPQPETGRMNGGLGIFLKGKGDGTFEPIEPSVSGIVIPEDAKALACGDLNNDGAPDLVCTSNNGPLRTLVNTTRGPAMRWSTLRLKGKPGNPTAIGSRVEIKTSTGRKLVREIYAGGSYLAQSSPTLFIALQPKETISEVTTRWPEGGKSTTSFTKYQRQLEIEEEK